MALNHKISTAARNASIAALAALLDGGTLEVRTGSPPTNPSDGDSGTLLGTLTFDDPAFGSPSTGTVTAEAIASDTSADNSGTAGHFRTKDDGSAVVTQGTAGASGDTPNLVFDNPVIVAGGTIAISSFTLTQPVQ